MKEPLDAKTLVARLDALRSENERLRAHLEERSPGGEEYRHEALKAAGIGTWRYDSESRRIVWSEEAARIFGIRREEFGGTFASYLDLVHQEDRPRVVGELRRILAGEGSESFRIEHRVRRKGGNETWIECRGRAERVSPDKQRMSGVVIDTTVRHALQDQIIELQQMETVGRLAGGVAHDFNNLLTAIIGSLELAAPLTDGESRELIESASEAAERAGRLTRQLLAFARRQVLEIKTIDMAERLRSTEILLRRVLPTNIEIGLEIPNDVWPVRADETQLEQVFVNLAMNSAEAMSGGGRLLFRVTNTHVAEPPPGMESLRGDFVKIDVEDTGVGIDPDVVRHVFEPFFTTKREGTGLGLSTAYGIVRQLGGYLTLHSQLNVGTTAELFLPRSGVSQPVGLSATGAKGSKRETLLAVEDNDLVRGVLARVLSAQGYTVLSARNGVEALEVAAAHRGDIVLVVTDVVMPEMDGPELVGALRKRQPTIRAIYVSGYTSEVATEHGVPPDADFLAKPYVVSVLASKIREVLDRP